jgi:glycosyltransferase involved in cell wall biosynthesis
MLMTSHHEGSNNSLKEALACNLPIVSVDVGDSAERLKDVKNCFVSTSREPSILASIVDQVFTNGQRSNGRDYIHLVSMEHIANEVIKVYKKAIP